MKDCSEVSRVVCASFTWAGKHERLSTEELDSYIHDRGSEAAIGDQFNDYSFWVATIGGRICGTVAIEENDIAKLYVDPAILRNRIGKTLFELAERIVAQSGHEELTAWAAFDAAIPFYRAMRMSAAGRKFDILGQRRGKNTMLMRKSLVKRQETEQNAPADAKRPRR
jgi:GNAT superfamily N-acetyltransferase